MFKTLKLNGNSQARIKNKIGEKRFRFLEHALLSIERLLPHVQIIGLKAAVQHQTFTGWADNERQTVNFRIHLTEEIGISGYVKRRSVPIGAGAKLERTLHADEKDICVEAINECSQLFDEIEKTKKEDAYYQLFDEWVVTRVLNKRLNFNIGELFAALRVLAEQTYENKSSTFGCLINIKRTKKKNKAKCLFPKDFYIKKKYRALSDGFHTAYVISKKGNLEGFVGLKERSDKTANYYPFWVKRLAVASRTKGLAVSLTRQGDIIVLDEGSLRFTYRLGKWHYWQHSHILDLLSNAARKKGLSPKKIKKIFPSLYRATLDISFRRSGGLFVVLRSKEDIRYLIREGDAISDKQKRPQIDKEFDDSIHFKNVRFASQPALAELASLDGAVVIDSLGGLIAYGAVIEPRKKGEISPEEGSRTKAAIGASNYGLAIKISSDGDISIYLGGKKFLVI